MKIYQAQPQDVKKILPLFLGYRRFYHQEENPAEAEVFLFDRISLGQSIIFYVEDEGKVVGFTQLYPLFCSLEMKRTWLLYDLFVTPEARKLGVASCLIKRADRLATETNSAFIMLSTASDNVKAQKLYEDNGYQRDNDFYVYNKFLK